MISRRSALHALAGGFAAGALAGPRLALADLPGDRRLVVVILRGGLDGLAAVPPFGDPEYARSRGALALARPGGDAGVLDLDGFFGLHPALGPLQELYRQGELLPIHAAAPPYRQRSHFDAQDVLENGTARPGGARDGWLNRAIRTADGEGEELRALALGESVPLVLRGSARVASWSPSVLPLPEATLLNQIQVLWEQDAVLGPALAEALRMQESEGGEMTPRGRGALRGLYGPRGFLVFAEKAGRMLRAADGPRLAVIEMGGWDTHANQGRADGRLAQHLEAFGLGLDKLKAELGTVWSQTAVLAMSEFGRTVAPNGSGGTDHGVGGAAFLLGGAVAGGRVLADWPGLDRRRLLDGRDLVPTLDLRSVCKATLHDHLGLDRRRLETEVFPDSEGIAILDGLFAA